MKKILIVISIMFSALWIMMPTSYASLDAEEELDILRVELFDNGFRFYGDNQDVMEKIFSNLYDYKENDELIIDISGNEIIDRFKITINKDTTILHYYNTYDNKKDYAYSGQVSTGINEDINNNRYYYDIYFVGYSYTGQTEEYLELNKIYPVIVNSIYSDYNKGLIEGNEKGWNNSRENYGKYYNSSWITAEQWGNIRFNQGEAKDFNGFTVLINGIFSFITAMGMLEILPGIRIAYIIGIVMVFGIIGFILNKRGGD